MSSGSWPPTVAQGRRLRWTVDEALAEKRRARRIRRHRAPGRSILGPGPTRIAILATPRSGNTWLRMMLRDVLELDELIVRHPGDLDWERLPERAVINLHWPATVYLQSFLEAARVKVVTISRHPFDVLVSILRFAQTEPETIQWLWGRGGDEDSLLDADPTSEPFAQWAMSERALHLIEVSSSWLAVPDVAHVSYDKLVESPEREVHRLVQRLSLAPVKPIAEAVQRFTPAWVNERSGIAHAWTATTDMWKEVLPADLVDQLRVRYRYQLRQLGLTATPDVKINRSEARDRWQQLYPDSDPGLAEEAYRAEVQFLDPPSTVASGSRFFSLVKVHNRGTVRWPDRLRYPLIRLGCLWQSTDGTKSLVLEDRYVLGNSIPPGNATYEKVSFATPSEPGLYLLQVDLVHEHVRWFGCGQPIEVTVC
jgi:hypothetical protein